MASNHEDDDLFEDANVKRSANSRPPNREQEQKQNEQREQSNARTNWSTHAQSSVEGGG
jgi:hypothetical protein